MESDKGINEPIVRGTIGQTEKSYIGALAIECIDSNNTGRGLVYFYNLVLFYATFIMSKRIGRFINILIDLIKLVRISA